MRRIFILLGMAVLLCSAVSYGQKEAPKRWKFDVSLGAAFNSGNVENLDLKNAGAVGRNDSLLSFDLGYKLVYSQQNGKETNKGIKGGAKVDFFQYDRWSPFVAMEFITNKHKGYDYKVSALSGVKFRILSKSDTCDYSVSCAFMFDRVDYTPEENKLNDRNYRLSLRPKMRQRVGQVLTLRAHAFYQPSLEDFGDYIMDCFGAVEVKVTSHFHIGFNVECEYRSEVPTDDYKHRDLYSEVVLGLRF
ncbi:MAG: DUF481 domain-containing protein [Paludibacteraceae bacterium]|nr:DUF481 domain-containing protein [Paludibacteraceae bacterium]